MSANIDTSAIVKKLGGREYDQKAEPQSGSFNFALFAKSSETNSQQVLGNVTCSGEIARRLRKEILKLMPEGCQIEVQTLKA